MLAQDAVAPAAPLARAWRPRRARSSCRNVSVRFVTDRRTVTALENISFSVERGGFLSLLGPSGCGKSTLLRVVADLIAPTSGQVSVFGMSPQEARQKRSLGFVFQDAALLPWRTALQNVELPAEVGGFARPAVRRADAARAAEAGRARRLGAESSRMSSPAACASASRSRARCSAGRGSC